MKKVSIKNLLNKIAPPLSIAFTLIGMLFFVFGKDSKKVVEVEPVVMSFNASPEFPEKLTFAGEKIDLRRYDMFERFDREINSFCYMHSTTMLTIKRANRYFPIIAPILKKEGVPEDLKYLAAIESSLNPRAYSPAAAAGLWQIIEETGKRYGLEVSPTVDERYHIEKSTEAACKYLKEAYQKYGSWITAAASYNAGQARISSQLKLQEVDHAYDLWLNEETSRYIFRLLALKQVMTLPYKYGFVLSKQSLYKPIAFDYVQVDSTITDLVNFAKKQDITYAQLKEFNPWLRSTDLRNKNGKAYQIAIPKKEEMFYNSKKSFPIYHPQWVIDYEEK